MLLFKCYNWIVSSPVGWVHLVGGAADLQGGPFFFKCEKAGEKTRAGGQDFSRGGPDPMPPPPTLRG